MELLLAILAVLSAYLIGAVPFGLIFARLFSRIDVRSVGSGNIGATNVLRAAGKTPAVLTLLADGLKGWLPVLLVRSLLPGDILPVVTGAAAVLGHTFPVYLRFRGGKGVATSYGVILAVTPWLGLASLLIWLAAALVWRYSSLSALISFGAYPILVFALHPGSRPDGALSLFLAGMIYARHRENIKRLLLGTEDRIGRNGAGRREQS